MKASNILDRLERASEVVFLEEWQAKFYGAVFGLLGAACLVCALWNGGLLIIAGICAVMAFAVRDDEK